MRVFKEVLARPLYAPESVMNCVEAHSPPPLTIKVFEKKIQEKGSFRHSIPKKNDKNREMKAFSHRTAQKSKFKVILKNSELLYMKTSSLALIFTILALFTVNCGEKGPVTTTPPGGGPKPPPTTPKDSLVYGSEFLTSDGTTYQALLEACNRCGRKWLSSNPWGGRTYNKCAPLSSDSPLHCKNWTSKGYLQIKFAEKKLPTKATVMIWPLYTYRDKEQWGQSFSGEGQAKPINENKGFYIAITGLQARALSVISETTNHVKGGKLNVEVRSGTGTGGTVMLYAEQMPRIKDVNPPSQVPCGRRPPDLLYSGSTNAFCINIGY